jgi:hypothetical protein
VWRAREALPSPCGKRGPACFAIEKPQIYLSYMVKTTALGLAITPVTSSIVGSDQDLAGCGTMALRARLNRGVSGETELLGAVCPARGFWGATMDDACNILTLCGLFDSQENSLGLVG